MESQGPTLAPCIALLVMFGPSALACWAIHNRLPQEIRWNFPALWYTLAIVPPIFGPLAVMLLAFPKESALSVSDREIIRRNTRQQEAAKLAAEQRAHALAIEQHQLMVERMAQGELTPISPSVMLPVGEIAFAEFEAARYGAVTSTTFTEKKTDSIETRRKGTITRSIVGGVVAGPAGAIIGGTTGKAKGTVQGTSTVTQSETETIRRLDEGVFLLTSHRILFVGSSVASVAWDEMFALSFEPTAYMTRAIPRYLEVPKGEHFELYDAELAEVVFRGIMARRSAQT